MKKLIIFPILLLIIPSIALAGFSVDGITDPASVDGVDTPASVDGIDSDYVAESLQADLPASKDNQTAVEFGRYLGNLMVAGRFLAPGNITLTGIDVQVSSKTLSPTQTVTCYLYSRTGDTASTDVPNSSVAQALATVSMSTASAGGYLEFDFTGYSLSNGVGYWAVFVSSTNDSTNYINLRYDGSDAQSTLKDQAGASWDSVDISSQLYLKIWGY
jgi:hypothetical protein